MVEPGIGLEDCKARRVLLPFSSLAGPALLLGQCLSMSGQCLVNVLLLYWRKLTRHLSVSPYPCPTLDALLYSLLIQFLTDSIFLMKTCTVSMESLLVAFLIPSNYWKRDFMHKHYLAFKVNKLMKNFCLLPCSAITNAGQVQAPLSPTFFLLFLTMYRKMSIRHISTL